MPRFLRIYMNDQLALGVTRREVARRAQRSNDGTELGDALAFVELDFIVMGIDGKRVLWTNLLQ